MNQDETKTVEEFRKIAERFYIVIESLDHTNRDDLLSQLYLILPDLIKHAATLPEVGNEVELDKDHSSTTTIVTIGRAEWSDLYETLKNRLAPTNTYWIVMDCWKDSESAIASLADDVADIYRDLRKGSNEQSAQKMAFTWRLLFYSHWGEHAVGALKAIHELISEIRN